MVSTSNVERKPEIFGRTMMGSMNRSMFFTFYQFRRDKFSKLSLEVSELPMRDKGPH